MDERWFVQVGDASRELSRDEAVALFTQGGLAGGSLVWTDGMPGWVAYAESALARVPLPTPPPLPAPLPALPADAFLAALSGRDPRGPDAPVLEVSDDGWQEVRPAPWRRYFARQLDVLVMGTLAWMMLAFVTGALSVELFEAIFTPLVTDNAFVSTILTTLVVVPILVVVTGLTGSSLGKWIMGVRVTRRDGSPIGIGDSIVREGRIYVKGMGFGVPIVSLITLMMAHGHLTAHGVTSWDKDQDWVVTHRPHSALQKVLFVFGVLAFLLLASYLRYAS